MQIAAASAMMIMALEESNLFPVEERVTVGASREELGQDAPEYVTTSLRAQYAPATTGFVACVVAVHEKPTWIL
jgi:hypothetical protein